MQIELPVNQSTNQLINFTLYLADSTLILSQRNSEWCAHGPILEQDIAITNITLDLIGQSRNFYQYAAVILNKGKSDVTVSEDTLAYQRTEREFKNLLICELPNGDWARTVLRQFFFSTFQYYLFQQLQNSNDDQLSAIAVKSLKEVTYHVKWSSEWVIRLGDGTDESHKRMKSAVDFLWMYTGEMFKPAAFESDYINLEQIAMEWQNKVKDIFAEATLTLPSETYVQTGGKIGKHTEHLGFVLAELQYLQRTYPGAEW